MANILLFADDAIRVAAYSYTGYQGSDPNDDLSGYGSGQSYIRTNRQMKRNAFSNNWQALRSNQSAFFGGVPQIAFSSSRMQRGEVLPTLIDNSIGIASYPAFAAIIAPATRFFLPSLLSPVIPIAAGLLAIIPAYGIGKAAKAGVRYFKEFGYKQRHIEQGGGYEDSETAYALRMGAISDMSSAMSYSRRWLGREAEYMR